MTALGEFLFPPPVYRTLGGIVRWWESRRLPFNLIVGGSGLFSLAAGTILSWLPPDPHGGFPPPAAVLVFGLLANLCYLLGPAAEIAATLIWGRKVLPIGPALYRMGLTFSVGLALLPALMFTIDWLFRVGRTLLG